MAITLTNYRSTNIVEHQSTDEGLIFACRRGEAGAWETLVNRYQRLIYTIPRRAGLDEDQAAEVFQRTFAKLFEHLDRIRQPTHIQAWLVTTARRETLRLLRERSSQRVAFSMDEQDAVPNSETVRDSNPLPDETIEQLEEQHLIRTTLMRLGERCRTLLTLLYYSAHPPSYADVAAVLAIPEGSLGPTRARCLEKLRRVLEHSGY